MRRTILGITLLGAGFVMVLFLVFFFNGWQSAIAEYPASSFNVVLEGTYAPFLAVAIVFILAGLALGFQKEPKQI